MGALMHLGEIEVSGININIRRHRLPYLAKYLYGKKEQNQKLGCSLLHSKIQG